MLRPLPLLLLAACGAAKPGDGGDDTGACAASTWYRDADGDGWGDDAVTVESCDAPAGHVAQGGDCDDGAAAVYPGAEEIWYDGADEDCSGGSDFDRDGDGRERDDDCDDGDPAVYPGAVEDCATDRDEDCDGTPNGASMEACREWYADGDGDGAAGGTSGGCACVGTAPYLSDVATDCDDGDAAVYPGAPELCDGRDNQCDGSSDEDEDGTAAWEDASGWTDLTAQLSAGTAADPVEWSAPGDGTLHLCAGEWFLNADTGSAADDVWVRGAGRDRTRIDAAGGQALRATSGGSAVTLEDLTIRGGFGARGGAVYAAGVDVTAARSRFEDNVASDQGGAIYVTTGSLTLRDTDFANNSAVSYGGAVQAFDSAVDVSGGAWTDNQLSGDGSWAYGGGLGVYVYSVPAPVSIVGASFTDDRIDAGATVYTGGGSLFLYHLTGADVVLQDVTITGSSVEGGSYASGGGAYLLTQGSGGSLTVEGLEVDGTAVTGKDQISGGGVYATLYLTTPASFTDLVVRDATAANSGGEGYGGGLTLVAAETSGILLDGVTLTGNSAGGSAASEGGGLWVYFSGGSVSVVALEASDNEAAIGGGGYLDLADGATASVLDTLVASNLPGGLALYASHNEGTLSLRDSVVRDHDDVGVWMDAPLGASAFLELYGSSSATSGVLANAGGGVYAACRFGDGNCDIVAEVVDFGEDSSADDNPGGDVSFLGITYGYGNDASFACGAVACR